MHSGIYKITGVRLYFLPVKTRVPLKFGTETLNSVTCARVALRVVDQHGSEAEGWGETPLSVQWVWPSSLPYETRHARLKRFCGELVAQWKGFEGKGHPLEMGHEFQEQVLRAEWIRASDAAAGAREGGRGNHQEGSKLTAGLGVNHGLHGSRDAGLEPSKGPLASGAASALTEGMPWLAALVCNSAFDIALHDAYGRLVNRPTYETYGPDLLANDLTRFLEPAENSSVSFRGLYPADYLVRQPAKQLVAWHLVGGLDLLEAGELSGNEPDDGHPLLLKDWITRDGLKCLKIKLRGNDDAWDYGRLVKVGRIALETGVEWLSADFNCTVQDPAYVNEVLDRLKAEQPRLFEMVLYVEQPFPYELEKHRIDVRQVSSRKPLFLDESAHDWRMVRLGRELGWTGVALKTCKTQTGAILSGCWSKAHGLSLMVQDLTNPMLAQIPHVLLAAHMGTIMGVETNAMQFYPAASASEEHVHPGLYQRRGGMLDLSTIRGAGFGYRLEEVKRELPDVEAGE